MATGGIAIALLVLMAIQTLWPIAKDIYHVQHTNYQVVIIPNIRYVNEYQAQAELAKEIANQKRLQSMVGFDIEVEHDKSGYFLTYSEQVNMTRKQARQAAKELSEFKWINNIGTTVRVQENGPKLKVAKPSAKTVDI